MQANKAADEARAAQAIGMHEPAPVFATRRLLARRWHAGDLAALMEVYGDAQAMRYVGDGQPLARADCERWISVTLGNYEQRGYGMYALAEAAGGTVVGFAGIVHPGGQAEPEVKYALRRSHWGIGLATEAVTGLLRHARDELGLSGPIATTHPENAASHRVLLKAGMVRAELLVDDDWRMTQFFRTPAHRPAAADAGV